MLKSSLIKLVMLLVLPFMTLSVQAQEYVEGEHYTKLAKQVRTQNPAKVEVVELFGYWCPHCNQFERYLGPWKGKQQADVDFKHIPVVFRPNQAEFAKAYYVAKALGVEDEAHPALFALIHQMRSWINTKEQLGEFFADFGVSEADFNKAYSSFSITSQMNRGKKKSREYRISGVPSMVVNGKYLITAEKAGSQKDMLKVVDFLVAKERSLLK